MKTRKEREKDFELNKHYAGFLREHFGWVSCHTNAYGCQWSSVSGGRGMMPTDEVQRIGRALENGESEDAN